MTFVDHAVATDAGPRDGNEDAIYASPRVVAVADGVGGHASGEVASGLAMRAVQAFDKRIDGASAIERAAAEGNASIAFVASRRPESVGMATTLSAVALGEDGVFVVAHIGDSRAYLLRDGELSRLTRDDSVVQALLDDGLIDASEAARHPQRSVVLEVLDGDAARAAHVRSLPARPGDRVLVCSDGVSDVLDDGAIASALTAGGAPRDAATALVHAALEAGTRDNASAAVADV